MSFNSAIVLGAIDVEAERGSQAHCTNDRMVGRTIFVRHYALTWEILVYKNVIRGAVRAVGKHVFLRVGRRKGIGLEARDNGVGEPLRERCIEERVVLGEIRWPSLKASFGELFPSRLWCCLNLAGSAWERSCRVLTYLIQQHLLFGFADEF